MLPVDSITTAEENELDEKSKADYGCIPADVICHTFCKTWGNINTNITANGHDDGDEVSIDLGVEFMSGKSCQMYVQRNGPPNTNDPCPA
jgi:hypothetical protein